MGGCSSVCVKGSWCAEVIVCKGILWDVVPTRGLLVGCYHGWWWWGVLLPCEQELQRGIQLLAQPALFTEEEHREIERFKRMAFLGMAFHMLLQWDRGF